MQPLNFLAVPLLASTATATVQVVLWANQDCTGASQTVTVGSGCINTDPGFSSLTLASTPGSQDGVGLYVQTGNCGQSSSSSSITWDKLANGACSGQFGFVANDIYEFFD